MPRRAKPKAEHVCDTCHTKFLRAIYENVNSKRKFCSSKCYHIANRGFGANNWRGGSWVEKSKGYVQISTGNGQRRPEHILIAEKALGRCLKKNEVVHHINGNKTDNRNSNLLICTNKYHTELHARMSMKYAQGIMT